MKFDECKEEVRKFLEGKMWHFMWFYCRLTLFKADTSGNMQNVTIHLAIHFAGDIFSDICKHDCVFIELVYSVV